MNQIKVAMLKLPKPDNRLLFIETACISVFLVLICVNAALLVRIGDLKDAASDLDLTYQRLIAIEKTIERFRELQATYLPCAYSKQPYTWEDVELDFNAIGFEELLHRLLFLNEAIGNKYHKEGIFILSDFYTVNTEAETTEPDGIGMSKPSFRIRGRLLCACQ